MVRERKSCLCDCDGAPLTKREAILLAGAQAFLECGYAATSMDAVSARAQVSKATVYAHFDSKKSLFEAVIRARCGNAFVPVELPEQLADPREALVEFGIRMITLLVSDEALAMYRLIVSEAIRHPEVGEVFYSVGPSMARACLTDLLIRLQALGLLQIPADDLQRVINLYVGMLKGDLHLRAMLGHEIADAEIDGVAEMAADFLLSRYGVTGRAGATAPAATATATAAVQECGA